LQDFRQWLIDLNPNWTVSREWLSQLFQSWRWSFKKPHAYQVQKYTAENIQYYCRYVEQIAVIPWVRLKFLVEASFESRNLAHNTAVFPVGTRMYFPSRDRLDRTLTMTIMTTLDPNAARPIVCDLREGTNTALTFFQFAVYLLAFGHLVAGDVLVLDNARIHNAQLILPPLVQLMRQHGVQMLFMPKYSPELNPCELVWSLMKTNIRKHRGSESFLQEVIKAVCDVNYEHVYSFYEKCIVNF